MNMKVSSLFNSKEFQKELDKIKQYMNMLGQSDRKIIITLDNDIGTDGEIYDRAKFDVKRNEIVIDKQGKFRVLRLPKELYNIICYGPVEIDEVYAEHGCEAYKIDSVFIGINRIHKLHVDCDTDELIWSFTTSKTHIDEVIVHGDSEGRTRFLVFDNAYINKIVYDKNCRYLYTELLGMVVSGTKSMKAIRSEFSKHVPGYELQFIEVKENGIIITGVDGDKAKRVHIPIPKISDSVLLEIYANSIFKHIEKEQTVVLEYFGIVIKDGEISCI